MKSRVSAIAILVAGIYPPAFLKNGSM